MQNFRGDDEEHKDLQQECTLSKHQVALATKFRKVARSSFEFL